MVEPLNRKESREDQECTAEVIVTAATGDPVNFRQVFFKYLPMIKKIWRSCKVEGLEREDWIQESQLVILRALQTYQADGGAQFSWFLKASLVNRIFDLYRQSKAQKRIPPTELESIEKLTEAFAVTNQQPLLDELMDVKDGLAHFWEQSSDFERQVLSGISAGESVTELARRYGCSRTKVACARSRCKKKLIRILHADS